MSKVCMNMESDDPNCFGCLKNKSCFVPAEEKKETESDDKHKIEEFIKSCRDYSDSEYADGWNAARDYILAFINKL